MIQNEISVSVRITKYADQSVNHTFLGLSLQYLPCITYKFYNT